MRRRIFRVFRTPPASTHRTVYVAPRSASDPIDKFLIDEPIDRLIDLDESLRQVLIYRILLLAITCLTALDNSDVKYDQLS
jgi:hypothetical protein